MSQLRRGAVVAATYLAALLAGCAATIEPKAMVPPVISHARQHGQPVVVHVSGGRESDSTGLPQISNEAFAEALATAISNSKVFSSVVPFGGAAPYLLKVNIAAVQQPLMGFTLTVTMDTGWQIEKVATGEVVWRKGVRSAHTAGVSDAFVAATRIRMATEAAARENIRQGLELISQLQL